MIFLPLPNAAIAGKNFLRKIIKSFSFPGRVSELCMWTMSEFNSHDVLFLWMSIINIHTFL
jgi:hypothetical protein